MAETSARPQTDGQAQAAGKPAAGNGEPHLRRAVGIWGSFAWGYADVGADVYVAVGLVAAYAQGALPVAFLAAGLVYVIVGFAYTELAAAYPVAGGSQYYTMRGLGDFWGFVSGWALLLDFTIDVSLFSLGTAGYLNFFLKSSLPWINEPVPLAVESIVLISFLVWLNIRGVREASWLNEVFSAIDLARETLILVLGFALAFDPAFFARQVVHEFPSVHNLLYGTSIAIVSYIGLESISQVAQETVKPATVIPRTSVALILTVLVYALGFSFLGLGTIGWQGLAKASLDPIVAIAEKLPLVGAWIAPLTAMLAATLIYASTNTGILGSSRITWSMSHFDLLPRWFHEVHPRYRTPVRTILVFSGIAVLQVVAATGAALYELAHGAAARANVAQDVLANMYAFGALSGYVLVLISLVRLRLVDPFTPRPWKVPLNLRWHRGRHVVEVPVLVLLGIGGNLAILGMVVATHPLGRVTGPLWILLGIAIFYSFRRRSGLSPWRTVPRNWEEEQIRVLTEAEEWESLRQFKAAVARRKAEEAHLVEDVD
jgi:APA family basic amino acid/polyamine antiporter